MVVAAVAQWGFLCVFTAAEKDLLVFFCHVFNRAELTALVGAVAKGLFLAFATATPKVIFTCLHLHDKRCVGGSHGCVVSHGVISIWEYSLGCVVLGVT